MLELKKSWSQVLISFETEESETRAPMSDLRLVSLLLKRTDKVISRGRFPPEKNTAVYQPQPRM